MYESKPKTLFSLAFAALDDVPFVVPEKFFQNPKEVKVVTKC